MPRVRIAITPYFSGIPSKSFTTNWVERLPSAVMRSRTCSQQLPTPIASAMRCICVMADAQSSTQTSTSSASAATTIAALHLPRRLPAPARQSLSLSSMSLSRTTINSQGRRFLLDAAAKPAYRIAFSFASGMVSSVYCRTLRRCKIIFNISIQEPPSSSTIIPAISWFATKNVQGKILLRACFSPFDVI